MKEAQCSFCKDPLIEKGQSKYCSRICMFSFWWQETKAELLERGFDTSDKQKVAKRYLIELHCARCQICKISEWMGKPIALVLDHIDGDSGNNYLTNLRVICNNCDAQTEHYKGKNKGRGRAFRRERYKAGKSY